MSRNALTLCLLTGLLIQALGWVSAEPVKTQSVGNTMVSQSEGVVVKLPVVTEPVVKTPEPMSPEMQLFYKLTGQQLGETALPESVRIVPPEPVSQPEFNAQPRPVSSSPLEPVFYSATEQPAPVPKVRLAPEQLSPQYAPLALNKTLKILDKLDVIDAYSQASAESQVELGDVVYFAPPLEANRVVVRADGTVQLVSAPSSANTLPREPVLMMTQIADQDSQEGPPDLLSDYDVMDKVLVSPSGLSNGDWSGSMDASQNSGASDPDAFPGASLLNRNLSLSPQGALEADEASGFGASEPKNYYQPQNTPLNTPLNNMLDGLRTR